MLCGTARLLFEIAHCKITLLDIRRKEGEGEGTRRHCGSGLSLTYGKRTGRRGGGERGKLEKERVMFPCMQLTCRVYLSEADNVPCAFVTNWRERDGMMHIVHAVRTRKTTSLTYSKKQHSHPHD